MLYIIICYARKDIITVCLFVSSVKCSLIIENLSKVMIRNPQKSVRCWMMEKQVTSNITQLSLAEKSGKMIGPSSVVLFLLDSIFRPRNERAAFECYFGSLFVFGSPEISSLAFSCGGTFACPLEVCL